MSTAQALTDRLWQLNSKLTRLIAQKFGLPEFLKWHECSFSFVPRIDLCQTFERGAQTLRTAWLNSNQFSINTQNGNSDRLIAPSAIGR
jgi:hypothetical protein